MEMVVLGLFSLFLGSWSWVRLIRDYGWHPNRIRQEPAWTDFQQGFMYAFYFGWPIMAYVLIGIVVK